MRMAVLVAGVGLALAAGGAARAAVTEEQFQVKSTGDLVALCAAGKDDPLYTAAQNFCHGFAVGTYRALVEVDAALNKKKHWFCAPNPPPSRTEAIAAFVTWAQANPDAMAMSPTDGALKYIQTTYTCH